MNNEVIISVKNLVKKFGHFTANDNISFEVHKGEIFGLLGANGAGKTTAIRILCGLLMPTSGELRVAGYDVYREREKIKRVIGYMSQKFSLYNNLTVEENIRFFGGIYGLKPGEIKKRMDEMLDRLDFHHSIKKPISTLPLGWKQKLALSIAIMHRPAIVFLDEPTSGVDPIARRQFWDLIYQKEEKGLTVMVTTHYMDEAEYCERLCILNEGRVSAYGSPAEIRQKYGADSIEDVFVQIVSKTV